MTIKRVEIISPRLIGLRPHHLFCLPGYKGNGYTRAHKTNWDIISRSLEINPDLEVVILKNRDALCVGCPGSVKGIAKCNEKFVSDLDKKIRKLLNLTPHKTYSYRDIMNNLFQIMTPQKHEEFCGDCGWWREGFCRDTFNGK